MHTATPKDLRAAGVQATDKPSLQIDDFSNGWQDWYLLSAGSPHHWEYSTRKINDPKWRGRDDYRLAFEVQAEKPTELVILLTENFFRSYRGKQRQFSAIVKLDGGEEAQTVTLTPDDFVSDSGEQLSSWANVDLLSFRAYHDSGEKLLGSKSWSGSQPQFRQLRWTEPEDRP